MPSFLFKGRVTDLRTDIGVPDLEVDFIFSNFGPDVLLGQTTTDSSGYFHRRLSVDSMTDQRFVFANVRRRGFLLATTEGVLVTEDMQEVFEVGVRVILENALPTSTDASQTGVETETGLLQVSQPPIALLPPWAWSQYSSADVVAWRK